VGELHGFGPEVIGDPLAPPAGLGSTVNHLPTPDGRRQRLARNAVEKDLTLIEIEVGHHSQEKALA
jgi:hypothetical protein